MIIFNILNEFKLYNLAMWPLKINFDNDDFDDHLILSFYGYTKLILVLIVL